MKEQTEPDDPVLYYDQIIAAYERAYKAWEGRGEKIVQRYRDEQRAKQDNDQTKFNILWSNVNTLVPATYSRIPQPDVARRFRDQDPVGRVASLILERALTFEIEHSPDFRTTMRQAVQDRFLPGRGTAWARYEPHFKPGEQIPEDGLEISEDIESEEPPEQIDYECAPTDYVNWKDFGHNIARTWEEVFCVWRIVYMCEEGVKERFGEEIASTLSYDATPEKKKEVVQEIKRQAKIYEIWDKQKKTVCWLSRSKKQMLDERDDPLGLNEFFPCPRPLYATMTNESLIPIPDFTLYQDQARELDIIADRIDGLVRMLQVKGCYDAATPELSRLFTEGVNGTLIPIKNYAAFAEKQGFRGSLDIVDLKPIYEAIRVCFESSTQIINFIYQITGISDIIRGVTEASETLGAQQMKVNFAGMRLGEMKRDVAQFATDLLQLKAQIICQHFSPETICSMAAVEQLAPVDQQLVYTMAPPMSGPNGQPMPPQPAVGPDGKPQCGGPAMILLLGAARIQDPEADTPNPLRAFRVEVNADSLVQMDEQAEQAAAKDLLGGLSRFFESTAQVAGGAPQMVPVFIELLKWALVRFKVGKNVEGTIDQALEQMKAAAMQPKPQQQDPKILAIQANAQAQAADRQQDAQQHAAELQQEAQLEKQKNFMEGQREQNKQMMDGVLARFEALLKAHTAIDVAEITAKSSLQAAQAGAAQQVNQ